ncbi:MAG: hypothetical protein KatS3mg076_1255 [Candidatus Binatia bacterium]|nr:MAG: hypothetical protein KatS3mg076_1255 [Candidatus Binatia bacterium]
MERSRAFEALVVTLGGLGGAALALLFIVVGHLVAGGFTAH